MLVVIGTSPTTNEVLVKNTETGEQYWKPGTTEQIVDASKKLAQGEAPGAPGTPSLPYQRWQEPITYNPPSGVTPEQPSAGAPAVETVSKATDINKRVTDFNTRWQTRISGSSFTGSEDDYRSYVSELSSLNSELAANQLSNVRVYNWRGESVEIGPNQSRDLSQLRGREQYDYMVQLGILDKDSEYVDQGEGRWGYLTPGQVAQKGIAEEQKKTAAETQRRELDRQALQEQGEQARQKAISNLGKYTVDGKTFDLAKAISDGVKPQTLKEAGFSENDINQTLADIQNRYSREQKVNTILSPYKSGDKYDVDRYLFDRKYSPEAISLLKEAGFSSDVMETASRRANALGDTQKYLNDITRLSNVRAGKLNPDDAIALERAMHQAGIKIKSGSAVADWRMLPDDDKLKVAAIFASDPDKSNAFTNTVASINLVSAEHPLTAGLVLAPVSMMATPIAKTIKSEPVSSLEWAAAGIIPLTLVGGPLGRGAGLALTGIMGKSYVENFSKLTVAEKSVYGGLLALGVGASVALTISGKGGRAEIVGTAKVVEGGDLGNRVIIEPVPAGAGFPKGKYLLAGRWEDIGGAQLVTKNTPKSALSEQPMNVAIEREIRPTGISTGKTAGGQYIRDGNKLVWEPAVRIGEITQRIVPEKEAMKSLMEKPGTQPKVVKDVYPYLTDRSGNPISIEASGGQFVPRNIVELTNRSQLRAYDLNKGQWKIIREPEIYKYPERGNPTRVKSPEDIVTVEVNPKTLGIKTKRVSAALPGASSKSSEYPTTRGTSEQVAREERSRSDEAIFTEAKGTPIPTSTTTAKPRKVPSISPNVTPIPRVSPNITPGEKPSQVAKTTPGAEQTVEMKVGSISEPTAKINLSPGQQSQPVPKLQPQPATKQTIKTDIAVGVNNEAPQRPPERTSPRPLKKQPRQQDKEYTPTEDDIKNSTAIKAGFGWWLRFPNGQLRFYRALPKGVKDVKPGKGSGYRSVQTVEGQPIDTTLKMGFQTVSIRKPSRDPGKPGAVQYTPNLIRKPSLNARKNGKMLIIPGMGRARRLPKGRIKK